MNVILHILKYNQSAYVYVLQSHEVKEYLNTLTISINIHTHNQLTCKCFYL